MTYRIEYKPDTGEFCLSDSNDPADTGSGWQLVGFNSDIDHIREFITASGATTSPEPLPLTDILDQWRQLHPLESKIITLSPPASE